MLFRSIVPVLVILVSAVVTGVGLHFLIRDDARSDIGVPVEKNGITVTLWGVAEMQNGTRLVFDVEGLPADRSLGLPVDFLADQGTFKFNGDVLDRPTVLSGPAGPDESSLIVAFDTPAGETGVFEIGRIYALLSKSVEGGEDRFVEGPWSFSFQTSTGP